jgi:hypothetical protein
MWNNNLETLSFEFEFEVMAVPNAEFRMDENVDFITTASSLHITYYIPINSQIAADCRNTYFKAERNVNAGNS